MIVYYEGTVFNTDLKVIVNTVNCVGVMGAGLALEFKLRYPKMYKEYKDKCKKQIIQTGKIDYYRDEDEIIIVNFPTKNHYRNPSKLEWIEKGLQNFVETYQEYGIQSVAFPKLGTNNGGLDWEIVQKKMVEYLDNLDIQAYICLDIKSEAEGVEKQMLDALHSTTKEQLAKMARLNDEQIEAIQNNMPYKRFWDIAKIRSVGTKKCSLIFKKIYKQVEKTDETGQIKLIGF